MVAFWGYPPAEEGIREQLFTDGLFIVPRKSRASCLAYVNLGKTHICGAASHMWRDLTSVTPPPIAHKCEPIFDLLGRLPGPRSDEICLDQPARARGFAAAGPPTKPPVRWVAAPARWRAVPRLVRPVLTCRSASRQAGIPGSMLPHGAARALASSGGERLARSSA